MISTEEDKSEYHELLMMYKGRFGKESMLKKTQIMWFEKHKDLDLEVIKEAFHQLLGSQKFKFGWDKVNYIVSLLNPKESEDLIRAEVAKANPQKADVWTKRSELGDVLRDLLKKNKNGNFNWKREYAKKFVEVWGVAEAQRQCAANNKTNFEFTGMVNEVVRKGMKI